jgi:hypothetical protein
MVNPTGMAVLAMLLPSTTAAAHATPAACSERLLPPSPGAATGQPTLSARDLVELRDLGEMRVSPDGRFAAAILRRADAPGDRYCMGLLIVPLSGGAPRLLDIGGEPILLRGDLRGVADIVNGTIDDSAPVWSPDGRTLAYLRRDRGTTQVWIAPLNGRSRQLTRLAEDARGGGDRGVDRPRRPLGLPLRPALLGDLGGASEPRAAPLRDDHARRGDR